MTSAASTAALLPSREAPLAAVCAADVGDTIAVCVRVRGERRGVVRTGAITFSFTLTRAQEEDVACAPAEGAGSLFAGEAVISVMTAGGSSFACVEGIRRVGQLSLRERLRSQER